MEDKKDKGSNSKLVTLTPNEWVIVEENVQLELNNFQHKMVKIGWLLSIFIGFFVILALYHKTKLSYLITWYGLLMMANTINVYIAHKNRLIHPSQTQQWRSASKEYHVILGLLCLSWGFLSILYTSHDARYQLYIVTWLQLCIVGFSFGTITDYIACVIANICILLPYVVSRGYSGFHAIITTGHDPNLNISLSIIPVILSVFSLMACYIAYRLVKNFFILSLENIFLRKKLEEANQFLENRVQERTVELENSLKLVKFQATHDLLTNLPNQFLLLEYVQQAIDSAYQDKHLFAVVCLTLNELEKINDSLGHKTGNRVIKAIANRFDRYLKEIRKDNSQTLNFTVTLSRKDELVIIIEPLYKNDVIENIVEKLFSILNEPVNIEKQAIKLTASIGVSIYPRDGTNVKSLLMNADAAMISAKKQGGNHVNIYKSELNFGVQQKLMIESQLYNAIGKNEFSLYYQPFVNSETLEICGGEALIRWNNPILGQISPELFIPLAEANGLIIPLGEWALRTACKQAVIWQKSGYTSLKIAINLSAKQLRQKNILNVIEKVIKEIGLNPKNIELELTETEAFNEETIPILAQLKKMGFRLSIDDFGTGYSGLNNLKLFSIDKLKIDKSFIRDLATNNDSKAIVANTIDLAKKIHVTVIAEGVETKEQLKFLQEQGCNMIQGYYFSRPVDTDTFTVLLKDGLKGAKLK